MSCTEMAVAVARRDTTMPGLEGGVTPVATRLNGPAPALLVAYKVYLHFINKSYCYVLFKASLLHKLG